MWKILYFNRPFLGFVKYTITKKMRQQFSDALPDSIEHKVNRPVVVIQELAYKIHIIKLTVLPFS